MGINKLPPDLQAQLLNEIVRIGEVLYTNAIKEEGLIYWKDVDYDAVSNEYIQTADENIYNGNSGFLLFFIELYQATKDSHYLDIIQQNATWIIKHCDTTPVSNIAFYSGRSGVSFVLLQVYRLTGEKVYLDKAKTYLNDCWHYYETNGCRVFDILNGTFGVLIALLHVYDSTADPALLTQISGYLNDLCKQVQLGRKEGLYWDRTHRYIDGLCGFSHGVAGIAWLLTEIATYFNNAEIGLMAKQALRYELSHFDDNVGNWPDYRKVLHSDEKKEEARQALLSNQMTYFTEPIFMCAWCHGAPGTGLALARIYELTGDVQCKELAKKALLYTLAEDNGKMTGRANYSLCHGPGGNSFLLNKMLRLGLADDRANPQWLNYGQKALSEGQYFNDYIHGLRNDCPFKVQSLFNGLSGVGYFYLSLYSEHFSTSILCPQITGQREADHLLTNLSLKSAVVYKAFPISFGLLGSSSLQQQVLDEIDFDTDKLLVCIHKAIANHLQDNTIGQEALRYESVLLREEARIQSNVYIHVYEEEVQRDIKHLLEALANGQSEVLIQLSQLQTLYESKYNWCAPKQEKGSVNDETYYLSNKGDYCILIKQTPTGIKAKSVNVLTKIVLQQLLRPVAIQAAINALARMIIDEEDELPRAIKLLTAQVAELIKAGIVVRSM